MEDIFAVKFYEDAPKNPGYPSEWPFEIKRVASLEEIFQMPGYWHPFTKEALQAHCAPLEAEATAVSSRIKAAKRKQLEKIIRKQAPAGVSIGWKVSALTGGGFAAYEIVRLLLEIFR